VAAGAVAGLAIAFLLGRIGQGHTVTAPPVVAVAAPVVAPPPPVTPPPPPVAEAKPATTEKAAEEPGDEDTTAEAAGTQKDEKDGAKGDEKDGAKGDADTDAVGKTRAARAAAAAAEARKMLAEGDRMLRAERFAEAREIFQKLTKSKKERGPALVGLAEISF